MKRLIFAAFAVALLAAFSQAAHAQILDTGSGYVVSGVAYPQVSLINQDPYPAVPGEYADLLFKIENIGTEKASNVVFQVVPSYPFSLETGVNDTTWVGSIDSFQKDTNAVQVKYRVRIDKDALDGDNEITIRYSYDGSGYNTKKFNVSVSDYKTSFEAVLQESTSTTTTIAIVNTGINNAYSVIVKVPTQEGFTITEPSSVVLGNLAGNDYTLASFTISKSTTGSTTQPGGFNGTLGQPPASNQSLQQSAKDIKVDISYTDELGTRRTVQKLVSLGDQNTTTRTTTRISSTTTNSALSLSNGMLYIIAGAGGIVAVIAFFLLKQRRSKKKHHDEK